MRDLGQALRPVKRARPGPPQRKAAARKGSKTCLVTAKKQSGRGHVQQNIWYEKARRDLAWAIPGRPWAWRHFATANGVKIYTESTPPIGSKQRRGSRTDSRDLDQDYERRFRVVSLDPATPRADRLSEASSKP